MTTPTLEALYAGPQTKVSDKWQAYLPVYDRILVDYRTRPINLLEIGIQNGGSLEIWAQFFPQANHLIGCDINLACKSLTFADSRIAVVVGDANTDGTADAISRHANDFDIILDDGSHTSPDIIRSFARYFPRLRNGGLYIIEDLHCSYWAEYGGGLFAPRSAMAFLRRLQDVVNFEHWGLDLARSTILKPYADSLSVVFPDHELAQIYSVEILNSLCVIRKQPAERNVLGRRVVVGTETAVGNDVLSRRDSLLQPSLQPAPLADPIFLEDGLMQRIAQLTDSEAALTEQIAHLTYSAAELTQQIEALTRSSSWRLTRPIRVAVGLLRGVPAYLDEVRRRAEIAAPRWLAGGQDRSRTGSCRPPSPGPRQADVDIILLVRALGDALENCLGAILRCTLPPYRLIIVHDGRDAATGTYLDAFASRHPAVVVEWPGACSGAVGYNAGLQVAPAPWVVLLDSGVIVTGSWLDRLVEAAEADGHIGVVGPLLNASSKASVPDTESTDSLMLEDWMPTVDPEQIAGIVARASARQGIVVPALTGSCVLVRSKLLRQQGPFPISTGVFAEALAQYCTRARKRSWKVLLADDVFVWHGPLPQSSRVSRDGDAEALTLPRKEPLRGDSPALGPLGAADTPALAGLKARIFEAMDWELAIAATLRPWEGRRIAFLSPVPGTDEGMRMVALMMRALRSLGVDAWLCSVERYRDAVEAATAESGFPVLYAPSVAEMPRVLATVGMRFDAVVATSDDTAMLLPDQAISDVAAWWCLEPVPNGTAERGPSDGAVVRSNLGDLRLFAQTPQGARSLEKSFGKRAIVLGPVVDTELCRPSPAVSDKHVHIAVRLGSQAGAASAHADVSGEVLKRLRRRVGRRVVVRAFTTDDDRTGSHPGTRTSATAEPQLLGLPETMGLLATSGIFIDLDARHDSLAGGVALAAMATGCAVVMASDGPAAGLVRDQQNAVLVDGADVNEWVTTALRLVTDNSLRNSLRHRAATDASFWAPRRAALTMLETLRCVPLYGEVHL